MATERFEIIIKASGTRKAQRGIRDIGKSANTTKKTLAFLRSALVVVASVRIIGGFIRLADSLTVIRNRLRLVTASTAELNTVQNALFKISERTRTSFVENVEFFNRLARATQQLGLNFGELLTVTESVALAIRISGATTQEAIGGLRQLSQALAAGAAQGEELRSIVENLPRIADAIARQFKLAGGQLIAFNKQFAGIIKSEAIARGLIAEVVTLRKELGGVQFTVEDSFKALSNRLIIFVGNLNDASGVGRLLSDAILTLAANLDILLIALLAISAVAVFNILTSQLLLLGKTLLRVTTLVTIFGRTSLRVFSLALVPLRGLLFVLFALIRPLTAIKILFAALRVLVLTNPLFLVGVAVIGALVAAFVIFEEEINAVIDSFGGLSMIFEDVVNVILAGVRTIISSWRQLPAAFADISIRAANNLVTFMQRGINLVIEGLNQIQGVDISLVELPLIENAFSGAADVIKNEFIAQLRQVENEGGGIKIISDRLQRVKDLFEKLTGGDFLIDESLFQAKPTIQGGTEAGDLADVSVARALRKTRTELNRLTSAISPAAEAQLTLTKATETLTSARKLGIDVLKEFGLTESEVLRRVERDLLGVTDGTRQFAESQKLLESALSRGIITLDEYDNKLQELRIEQLETERTLGAGLERFFLRLQKSSSDAATQIEEVLGTAFRGAEDALVRFVQTGKFSFSDLVNSILADITRLAFRDLAGSLGGLLGIGGGGGGGFLSSIFGGGGGGLPGMNSGGSFSIGGMGGVDRNVLSINGQPAARVSRGETVTVSPSGQQGGDGQTTIIFNISTPDAESFRRSEGQIFRRAQNALSRANRRDG